MERSLVISVSARPGCYRHIQISENATLFKLHEAIVESFDFIDDHMHAFFMNNHAWDSSDEYLSPGGDLDDTRGFTDKVKLINFHIKKNDRFLNIFDFGDEWRFRLKVLRVIDDITKIFVILKSVGEPIQYGYDDDDEDGDEND